MQRETEHTSLGKVKTAVVELQLLFQFKFEKGTSCTKALLTIIIHDSSDYDTCVGL